LKNPPYICTIIKKQNKMTTADLKKNELILELSQRLDSAITEKNEMEANKNKIIKEQLELIKELSKQLNII